MQQTWPRVDPYRKGMFIKIYCLTGAHFGMHVRGNQPFFTNTFPYWIMFPTTHPHILNFFCRKRRKYGCGPWYKMGIVSSSSSWTPPISLFGEILFLTQSSDSKREILRICKWREISVKRRHYLCTSCPPPFKGLDRVPWRYVRQPVSTSGLRTTEKAADSLAAG